VKKSPEARAKIRKGRERPHPLTHRASRLLWGRSRPEYALHVRLFAPRTRVQEEHSYDTRHDIL
jgi:hypothetical protein